MTEVKELRERIGDKVDTVEYVEGDDVAYLIFTSGYGIEVKVEPEESEE